MKAELAPNATGKPFSTQSRQGAKAQRGIISGLASLLLCVLAFIPSASIAATNDLSGLLQKGLFEEEANRNLDAASAAYETLVKQFDQDRQIGATAVFRLGEVYRKQNKTNEAVLQYERIIRDFAEQTTLVTLSKQNLAGMGVLSIPGNGNASTGASRKGYEYIIQAGDTLSTIVGGYRAAGIEVTVDGVLKANPSLNATRLRVGQTLFVPVSGVASVGSSAARKEQKQLLEEEIKLAEQDLAEVKKLSQYELRQVLPTLVPDQLLIKLLEQQQTEETKLAALNVHLSAEHPEVIAARKTLQKLDEQIGTRMNGIIKALELRAAAASSTSLSENSGTGSQAAIATVVDEEETEIRRIKAMMQNSPDLINAPVPGGLPPLQQAANAGQLTVARFLLDNGANVNARTSNTETALTLAAARGYRAMVELLLARGAEVNAAGGAGYTALHQAALSGFKAVAEVLLASKANLHAAATDGATALHLAAGAGNTPLVELLLTHEAKADAVNNKGQTPLMLAASGGHAAAVKALLASGAAPNAQDASGRTALSFAAQKKNPAVVKVLLEAKADPNAGKMDLPLAWAAHENQGEMAELLLQAGADPNLARNFSVHIAAPGDGSYYQPASSYGPYTPLQIAVARNRVKLPGLFFKFKADPNAVAPWYTPIHPLIGYAMSDVEMFRAFLDAGADPDALYRYGEPLLVNAAEWDSERTELLLKHGAKVNIRGNGDRTPLHAAAEKSDKKTVELLLAAKAEVNAVDKNDRTPLRWAVEKGSEEIVELLLAHGADVNRKDGSGNTPLHWAVNYRQKEICELLLKRGANPNVQNNQNQTPLDWAKALPALPRPGLPPIVSPAGTSPQNTRNPATPAELIVLLKQHGALDDLPDFTRIEMRRAANYSGVAFDTSTNGWNEFTLLELIARQYGFISTERNALWEVNKSILPSQFWGAAACQFPDLERVVIRRVETTGVQRKEMLVNVAALLEAGDCARDVKLKPGDIVEIPEADHPINEKWAGLSGAQMSNLLHCVSRTVTISIKATPTTVQLAPQFKPTNTFGAYGERTSELTKGSFMLKSVLAQSRLLRASSDLSHVKVTRRAGTGGKPQEWLLDCSSGNDPDLWLHDGDVIEVPDKS